MMGTWLRGVARDEHLVLPLDLVVRFGICQLYKQELQLALSCFNALKKRVGQLPSISWSTCPMVAYSRHTLWRSWSAARAQDPASDTAVAPLLEDVACAFMDTGRHFRALDMLRRLDGTVGVLSAPAAIRVKLRMARSYLALNQVKGAAMALEQVKALCAEADGAYEQAEREASMLMATALRGLQDQEGQAHSLEVLTGVLRQVLQEPLPAPRRRTLPYVPVRPLRVLADGSMTGHPTNVCMHI
jgi:hypothetical protein